MARTRPPVSLRKRIFSCDGIKTIIYCEGKHENTYLSELVKLKTIKPYEKGTGLQASAIKLRIKQILQDLNNDAVEQVFWIVDGGDEHIKKSSEFKRFYAKWLTNKDGDFQKLDIMMNSPCFEYWFLLHKIDPLVDSKGNPICYADAKELYNSQEFKSQCPNGKGAQLVRDMVSDAQGRYNAIERAKTLLPLLENLNEKKLFSVARAEIFRLV